MLYYVRGFRHTTEVVEAWIHATTDQEARQQFRHGNIDELLIEEGSEMVDLVVNCCNLVPETYNAQFIPELGITQTIDVLRGR